MLRLEDFNRLVIIADDFEQESSALTEYSLDLNRPRSKNVRSLTKAFEQIFPEVKVYNSIKKFSSQVNSHKSDLIFPYWNGKISRNKMGLIASICEVERLYYVGGDAYSNIICGDKVISKDVLRIAGMKYPPCKVLYEGDQSFKWNHGFPVVVKPIYEGSSMGITQKNIVSSPQGVVEVATELIQTFGHPVMVEKFVPGPEVTVSIIGSGKSIKAWSAAERVHLDDPSFFDHNVFGFQEKIQSNRIVRLDARNKISIPTLKTMGRIIRWLDKIDYIRIDGKIWENEFWCFELSHDASMNPTGSFFGPFRFIGMDFQQSLRLILESSLERYNNLSPSRR